jgi:hypothetical protein
MRMYRREKHPDLPELQRPWAVTASSRILFIQAMVFLYLTWQEAPRVANPTLLDSWLAGLLFFLSMYALLASFNFLRVRAPARNRAMLVQGLTLGVSMLLYATIRPLFIYSLMVLSIIIVLYLQHPDVLESFPYKYESKASNLETTSTTSISLALPLGAMS